MMLATLARRGCLAGVFTGMGAGGRWRCEVRGWGCLGVDGLGLAGRWAVRASGTGGLDGCGRSQCAVTEQGGDQRLVGTGGGEREPDTGGGLAHAGGQLDQAQLQRGEAGALQPAGRRDGVAQEPQQPVGPGVQDQPQLVGIGAGAGGAVGVELRLVLLDPVLGLSALAVDELVEPLGR